MNIEPDIFDYLETTSLEPHDDYTSEITYKDQKIIWNKLIEQDNEIERLNKESEQLRTALNTKETIIKEVREYVEEMPNNEYIGYWKKEILEILDKEKE